MDNQGHNQDHNQDHNQAPPQPQGYPQPPMPPPPRAPQPPMPPQDYASPHGYPPQPGGYPPPMPPQGYPPQPGGYPPPMPPQGYPPQPGSYPGKGMSIASLVLGICTLTISWLILLGPITAIVGLVLGIAGKKKAGEVGATTGMATAGIVLCAIGAALSILVVIVFIVWIGTTLGAMEPAFDNWNYIW